ncbi:MAG: T9SS type A sorting domain-containing protein [Chitinophagales bacterium]|nr:T9SS type A sorting domain-containing protein [Chitinophagales bacterium]
MLKFFVQFISCLLLYGYLAPTTAAQGGTPYTSYMTGDTADVNTLAQGGICLMGGATENDSAMVWFLRRAAGGDVVVLRASGSNGYNDYMYSELGISINSVQTLVVSSLAAANHPYIAQQVSRAEAIWIAGGDQANYINYWRNSPVEAAIHNALSNQKAVIGGTSAGMAVLGSAYFSALNGSVTSAEMLANPYNTYATLGHDDFISLSSLKNTICDTHYDDPDRRARHLGFLARMATDWQIIPHGIACEEYTAVCIDTTGITRVFGNYPANDDFAYFLQANCDIAPNMPELCMAGQPLTWLQGTAAVKVYKVPGTALGSYTFDLNDWTTGSGGEWQHWYANNGVFDVVTSSSILEITAPDCNEVGINTTATDLSVKCYPNPSKQNTTLLLPETSADQVRVQLYDYTGKCCLDTQLNVSEGRAVLPLHGFNKGMYIVHISNAIRPTTVHRTILLVE